VKVQRVRIVPCGFDRNRVNYPSAIRQPASQSCSFVGRGLRRVYGGPTRDGREPIRRAANDFKADESAVSLVQSVANDSRSDCRRRGRITYREDSSLVAVSIDVPATMAPMDE
jgi:hypothetical protein